MNTAFRKPCFSAILCGAALLAPQARAQSADSAGILSTTPQSVEDLQRIEHQLQQVPVSYTHLTLPTNSLV